MASQRQARERRLAVNKEQAKRKARQSLLAFTRYTFPNFRPNWHHRLLCQYLDAFVRLEIPRLIVSMPPRMGKTELVSKRLPAYILGQDPDARIIAASYTSKLVINNSRATKRIIKEPSYQELFPGTKLGRPVVTDDRVQAKNTADEWEIVGAEGGYRGVGTGGSVTGFGGKYLLNDDLVKGRKEAESTTQQEALWDWLNDDLLTRGEEPFGVLLCATRWTQNDPSGRLVRDSGEKWVVLDLPAIKENDSNPADPREIGEPLWPEWFAGLRTPISQMPPRDELVRRALERYEKIQQRNPYGFAALFQQSPRQREGNIIKLEWCKKRYTVLPDAPGEWIQSWDCKQGSKDPKSSYVAGQVWFKPFGEARYYLVDRVKGRWDISETMFQIERMTARWPRAVGKLVESKADGKAVVTLLHAQVPGLILVPPCGGKENRVEAVSPYWQAGNVWLPDKSIAPWVDEFVDEITTFPGAPNDDEADAMSQALGHWIEPQPQPWTYEPPQPGSRSPETMQF